MIKNDPAIDELIASIRTDFSHLLGDFAKRLDDPEEVEVLLEILAHGRVPADTKSR